MPPIIIYSALFGNHGRYKFRRPVNIPNGYKYILFTDREDIDEVSTNTLEINRIKAPISDNPTKSARFLKTQYWEFIPSAQYNIWMDINYQANQYTKYICNLLKKSKKDILITCESKQTNAVKWYGRDMPLSWHSESQILIERKQDDPQVIQKQVNKYIADRLPVDLPWYMTGLQVRKDNSIVRHLMKSWWSEIQVYSRRDQISFPYVAWKNYLLDYIETIDIHFCLNKFNWQKFDTFQQVGE